MNDSKLELRAKRSIFLDYTNGVKGYKSWCIDDFRSSKIIINRDYF